MFFLIKVYPLGNNLIKINAFEAYEIWTWGDPWINIMHVISSLI